MNVYAQQGTALTEFVVVLPLLLIILGGVTDVSRALTDRAETVEMARTIGRACSRTWVINEPRVAARAEEALTRYLAAAGYDRGRFQLQARLLDLNLGGSRYTKAVEITVSEDHRGFHFLPRWFEIPLAGRSVYRLENAHVEIRESESTSY